jgi:hypothetical protein
MPVRKIDARKRGNFRGLFYGSPGSGKTFLAGSAAADPRLSPVLHIDIGGNTASLAMEPDVPDIIGLEGLDDLQTIWAWLRAKMPATSPLVRDLGLRTDYKTIILDGVTEIYNLSMARSSGSETDWVRYPSQFERQHYNPPLHHLTNVARAFLEHLSVRHNVIVTALEDTRTENDITRYMPMLAGKAGQAVTGYAYNVGRVVSARSTLVSAQVNQIAKKQGTNPADAQSIVFFQPIGKFDAKDQHKTGIVAMLDPTMTKIIDRWERRLEQVRDQPVEPVE